MVNLWSKEKIYMVSDFYLVFLLISNKLIYKEKVISRETYV